VENLDQWVIEVAYLTMTLADKTVKDPSEHAVVGTKCHGIWQHGDLNALLKLKRIELPQVAYAPTTLDLCEFLDQVKEAAKQGMVSFSHPTCTNTPTQLKDSSIESDCKFACICSIHHLLCREFPKEGWCP
jgi:hypothetical protein